MGRRRTFGNVRKLPSGRYQARYFDASGYRMGHSSAAAALRREYATRAREPALAQALDRIIEEGRP